MPPNLQQSPLEKQVGGQCRYDTVIPIKTLMHIDLTQQTDKESFSGHGPWRMRAWRGDTRYFPNPLGIVPAVNCNFAA